MSDKSYQQLCMKRLLAFLLDHGYDSHVSMKTLRNPSGKDFESIMSFMMRRVDPGFQKDSNMKFEDEVSQTLKHAGYPFPISKTALVSAGAAHTWPQLLALLSWLVIYLENLESIPIWPNTTEKNEDETTAYESVEQLEDESRKRFYTYLSEIYATFLSGDNMLMEEMEANFAHRHEKDDEFLEQEIERISEVNENMKQRIAEGNDQSQE